MGSVSRTQPYETWLACGALWCRRCCCPMQPCPTNGDEPGYAGYYPCRCDQDPDMHPGIVLTADEYYRLLARI